MGYRRHFCPVLDKLTLNSPSARQTGGLTIHALDHLIHKYAHLAQPMNHDLLDTTLHYVRATRKDLQGEMEKIAWR